MTYDVHEFIKLLELNKKLLSQGKCICDEYIPENKKLAYYLDLLENQVYFNERFNYLKEIDEYLNNQIDFYFCIIHHLMR